MEKLLAEPYDRPIRFDTKVAVLLGEDLAGWQRLNVTGFLISGITASFPQLIGEPYQDADGVGYLAMLGQPVLVFEGSAQLIKQAHERALRRDLAMSIFTSDLFATGNDLDNRAAVAKISTGDLDLVGIAVHGPRNAVDRVVKGARMHP
ncbi:DUF2000 domain-containing protein [Microlunatus sp. Gsoil 973]|uniref:DUF2000 domain-containing protein n=1 Tax=Microlunatus sp. Gsoil 973 TaxID=2672569 RepID=UPI0012B477F7|nr:DUF2000 domain-containing protein [Microlunatus sp. Gsoil 973]QGN31655.1 DUF2000 family protein [Microlunatus sp. Gsoil 973]